MRPATALTILSIWLVVLSFGVSPATGAARQHDPIQAAPLPAGTGDERLMSIDFFGGVVTTIAAQGGYAYVGMGHALEVLDITDPARPHRLIRIPLPGPAQQIVLAGDYAYIAISYIELRVLSIANPASPVEAGSLPVPSYISQLVVAGRYLYIMGSDGLQIVDIASPAAPVIRGHGQWSGRMAVSGAFLYLAISCGLLIINVADPAHPAEAHRDICTSSIGNVIDIAVDGHYAYVGYILTRSGYQNTGFLQSYDISNPTQPVMLGSIYFSGGPITNELAIVLSGQYVFAVTRFLDLSFCSFGVVDIIDISDPTAPDLMQGYSADYPVFDIAVADRFLYLSMGSEGMDIVDLADLDSPKPVHVGVYGGLPTVRALVAAGQHVYLGLRDSLQIVDTAVPDGPVIVGTYMIPDPIRWKGCQWSNEIWQIQVAGDYAYISTSSTATNTLQILNISNPRAPSEVGNVPIFANTIKVIGNYLYTNFDRLTIVDITDPSAPRVAGYYDTQMPVSDIAVAGHYAYVSSAVWKDGSGITQVRFHVLDIADPAHPQPVGVLDLDPGAGPPKIAMVGHYAYLTTKPHGLRIIDISNPATPSQIGFFDTPDQASSIVVDGQHAYVAEYDGGGLLALDISNPAAPVLLDTFKASGGSIWVAVAGGNIYTTNGYGFAILRLLNMPYRAYLPLVGR